MSGVPRLHAVTDAGVLALSDLAERARTIARAGVALHCRHAPTARDAVQRVEAFLRAAHGAALVLVNDRADIARATGAHGVHLPADGLPVKAARRLVGAGALVGRSAHTPDDVRRAADDGADYVFLGPIWRTRSHPDRPAVGLEALRAARHVTIPVIAIGGVTPERAVACVEAGAFGAAAISALWYAPEPGSVVERFLLSFGP